MLYTTVLTMHSWLRWITLILAIAATLNALRPVLPGGRLPGKRWDTFFMAAVDLQVLMGLFLYFGLSPFTLEAMNDMGAAMKNSGLRFWAVEHAVGMFTVMALVRVGRILSAGATSPAAARTRRLVFFALALIVMLGSIPWPGMANGRPLFRV